MEYILLFGFPFWLLCGIAGGAILSRYNKAGTGFLLGFLLGPLGLILAWAMRDHKKHSEEVLIQTAQEQHSPLPQQPIARNERKCPFCAELILEEAIVCKHCGRNVGNAYSSLQTSLPTHSTISALPESIYSDPIPPDFQSPTQSHGQEPQFSKFRCSCGARLVAKSSISGKTVKCPKCNQTISIP